MAVLAISKMTAITFQVPIVIVLFFRPPTVPSVNHRGSINGLTVQRYGDFMIPARKTTLRMVPFLIGTVFFSNKYGYWGFSRTNFTDHTDFTLVIVEDPYRSVSIRVICVIGLVEGTL